LTRILMFSLLIVLIKLLLSIWQIIRFMNKGNKA
jgi:hypothetical protein